MLQSLVARPVFMRSDNVVRLDPTKDEIRLHTEDHTALDLPVYMCISLNLGSNIFLVLVHRRRMLEFNIIYGILKTL